MEIYWSDLTPEAQQDLIDNGFDPEERNVDDIPICVLVIE